MYRNIFPRAIRNDNNLLVTLYLLLNLRQINAVADELCVSQSAVSQKLSRLRELFNDQLLIRNRGQMLLTAFSQELLPRLDAVVKHMEDVYNVIDLHETVRPTKKTYTVCLHGDSYIASISMWLMSMLNELSMEKEVSFKIVTRSEHSVDDLRDAKIDFYVGNLRAIPASINSLQLRSYDYSFAVDKQHPLATKTITPGKLSAYDFIHLSDNEELGLELQRTYSDVAAISSPVLQTQSIAAIRKMLEHSEMFSFLPDETIDKLGLAKVHVKNRKLTLDSHIYWHNLLENDTFHSFVRKRILSMNSNNDSLLSFYDI